MEKQHPIFNLIIETQNLRSKDRNTCTTMNNGKTYFKDRTNIRIIIIVKKQHLISNIIIEIEIQNLCSKHRRNIRETTKGGETAFNFNF